MTALSNPPPTGERPAVDPAWYNAPPDDEIDLFELWDILWDGRWLVILFGGVCTALAIVYALLSTPIYEARVVMVPAEEKSSGGGLSALAGQFGGLASLAGVNLGGGGGQSATALEILGSHAFLAEFIESQSLLPVLFAGAWDEATKGWSAEVERPPTLQRGVRRFKKGILRTATDKSSGVVTVTIAWTNPDQAAQWANALVSRLNSALRSRDVAEAQQANAYLQARLAETTNVDMQQTLYRLIESQTKTIMLANVRDDYVFRIVDPAFVPEQRSKPKRSLIVVLGGMLGGMLGVMAVFGRRVVRSYREREAAKD